MMLRRLLPLLFLLVAPPAPAATDRNATVSLLPAATSPDGRYRLEQRTTRGGHEQRLVLLMQASHLRREIYAFRSTITAQWSPDSSHLFISDDSGAAGTQCHVLRLSDFTILPLHDVLWRSLHPQAPMVDRYAQSYRCAGWHSSDRILVHETSYTSGRTTVRTIAHRLSFSASTSDMVKTCDGTETPTAPPLNATYAGLRRSMSDADWRPHVIRNADGVKAIDDRRQELETLERAFWSRGMREVDSCTGTGSSPCAFNFTDRHGNRLTVITEGEDWRRARIHGTRISCAAKKTG